MTRDVLESEAKLPDGRAYLLSDTGGYDPSGKEKIPAAVRDKAVAAIKGADLVFLVMDASAGVLAGDRAAARIIREAGRECAVVANKIDRKAGSEGEGEAWELGFPEVYGVSAEHDIGIDDLQTVISEQADQLGRQRRIPRRDRRARPRDRPRGRRAPERREVVARQRAARRGARDRVGDRGHHPRLGRRAHRGGGPALPPRGHGRDPAPRQDRAGARGPVGRPGAQAHRGVRRGAARRGRERGAHGPGRERRVVRRRGRPRARSSWPTSGTSRGTARRGRPRTSRRPWRRRSRSPATRP